MDATLRKNRNRNQKKEFLKITEATLKRQQSDIEATLKRHESHI